MKHVWVVVICALGLSCVRHKRAPLPVEKQGASESATQPAASAEKTHAVMPQAEPVVALLRAARNSDLALLKTVWSSRMTSRVRPADADEHWKRTLKMYQGPFRQQFGQYDVEDFTFQFEGNDIRGKVIIDFKGKKLPGLRVVKEGDSWKLNER